MALLFNYASSRFSIHPAFAKEGDSLAFVSRAAKQESWLSYLIQPYCNCVIEPLGAISVQLLSVFSGIYRSRRCYLFAIAVANILYLRHERTLTYMYRREYKKN